MTEELAKHGIFFDYLYNLRVIDPNVSSDTSDLKDKSGDYTESKQQLIFRISSCSNFSIEFFFFFRITGLPNNNRRIYCHCQNGRQFG